MLSGTTGPGPELPARVPAVDAHSLRGASPTATSQIRHFDGYAAAPGTLESRSSFAPQPYPPHPIPPPPSARPLSLDAARRPVLAPLQEYHSGFSNEADSASTALSNHRRQQSFPILLPPSLRDRTPSPTRRNARFSVQMPFTGDGRDGRAESPRRALAGWFGGGGSGGSSSASSYRPPTPGGPGGSRSRASSRDTTPETTPTNLRPRPSVTISGETGAPALPQQQPQSAKSTVSNTASRFMSAFSRFTQAPVSPTVHDELCSLNIEAALFPLGVPRDGDPFSPAAFKNLHINAVGLVTKIQTAYRERVAASRELEAERSAQRDELEEAETRAQHLKMQLEGMARKAMEHEKAMERLVEELAAERKARAEEQQMQQQQLQQLQQQQQRFVNNRTKGTSGLSVMTDGSTVSSEDLGVDEDQMMRRKWRKSAGTVKSDASFDTDEESAESESVFSRSRSPTIAPVAVFDGATTSSVVDAPVSSSASSITSSFQHTTTTTTTKGRPLAVPRGRGEPQLSTFQKMIKGMSRDAEESGPESCRNCKGQSASVAWDTVGLLREENKHLKQRVGELEVAVEGALDLVNGIGL